MLASPEVPVHEEEPEMGDSVYRVRLGISFKYDSGD